MDGSCAVSTSLRATSFHCCLTVMVMTMNFKMFHGEIVQDSDIEWICTQSMEAHMLWIMSTDASHLFEVIFMTRDNRTIIDERN